MNWILNPEIWMSLFVLTVLEVTLSADNIIFLVTICNRLPEHQQNLARRIGLILAMVTRLAFLTLIFSASRLTTDLFHIGNIGFSIRELVFLLGGAFLAINPLIEIREIRKMSSPSYKKKHQRFFSVLLQIMLLDFVFSIDSVITAIGVSEHYGVMIAAIIIAVLFMLVASNYLANLVQKHPILKVIALCFLTLIGVILVLRGFKLNIPGAYIYIPFVFVIYTQLMLFYARIR